MTPMQKAFVQEYLIDTNATQAAKRAGYSDPNIGRQLITKNNVSAAIKAAMDKRAQKAELRAEDVINGLMSEAHFKGRGASHGARVSAWEKLGKHLGIFEKDNVQRAVNIYLGDKDAEL